MATAAETAKSGSSPSGIRLKLATHTSPIEIRGTNDTSKTSRSASKDRASSPIRPSYSPVTPTLPQATIAHTEPLDSQPMPRSESLPVSLDENSDAIALRATISILQMQRQQSLHDIRSLDKLKRDALKDPEGFVQALKDGKLHKQASSDLVFDHSDDDDDDAVEDNDNDKAMRDPAQDLPADSEKLTFSKLPTSQNVVRCPPIEWNKYHIVGQRLDELHLKQQRFPGSSDKSAGHPGRSQPHEIAAPYRPFIDRLNPVKDRGQDRLYRN